MALIRSATAEDMPLCALILNRWIDATCWMPRCHDPDDVIRHYCEKVWTERKSFVADINATVAGFLALSEEGFVTALYVDRDHRGRGLGARLLERAKDEFPDGLQLWTFLANSGARAFYQRAGFVEERRTEGDNEEGLPDVLYRWDPRMAAQPRGPRSMALPGEGHG